MAANEGAQHAFTYGGDRDGADFDYLLQSVSRLSRDWNRVNWSGRPPCVFGAADATFEPPWVGERTCCI